MEPRRLKNRHPGQFCRQIETIRLDSRVLGFSLLLAAATGVIFGLAPAWRAAQTSLPGALKAGGRGGDVHFGGRRIRGALVVTEIALALMLSVGAGLMIRSFWRLNAVDPGFHPEHLLAVDIAPNGPRYAGNYATLNFARQVAQRVAGLPDVAAADPVNTDCRLGDTLDANIAVTIGGKTGSQFRVKKSVAGLRQVSPAIYFLRAGSPLICSPRFFRKRRHQPCLRWQSSMKRSPGNISVLAAKIPSANSSPVRILSAIRARWWELPAM